MSLSVKFLILVLISLPTLYLFGETFVVAKKKKAPSHSKLKEECCTECATILELTPELLRAVAAVQDTALANLRTYIDDGKDGFIATKSKAQLTASHEKLQALRANLERLTREIQECQTFLETGYLKLPIQSK